MRGPRMRRSGVSAERRHLLNRQKRHPLRPFSYCCPRSSLLPGCHAHGRDRGEATLRFQQAAKAHLEALLETDRPIPPAFRDKLVLTA